MRYSSYTDPLAVLEHTLSWKHLAPTTPDTLSCFPYTIDDPFILEEYPQIYFAANQASQQHKIFEGIVIAIATVYSMQCLVQVTSYYHYVYCRLSAPLWLGYFM